MGSAEEIRARVKQADEQRIATRANAAARVGEIAEQRDEVVSTLAELDKALGTAVSDALTVMSADELAQFTARPRREVEEWSAGTKSNSRRRPTTSPSGRSPHRPSRSTRPRANQPATEPSGLATEPASATEPTGTVPTVVSPATS